MKLNESFDFCNIFSTKQGFEVKSKWQINAINSMKKQQFLP
jgi:phage I-like protein